MYSPETISRIHQLRAKEQNQTLTTDDMKEVVKLLRQDRMSVQASGSKTKGPSRSADAMLDELDSM